MDSFIVEDDENEVSESVYRREIAKFKRKYGAR